MQEFKTIGVIGHRGMVGSVVYKYFTDQGYKTYGYSKTRRSEQNFVDASSLIFVCVPTPYDWKTKHFDGSIVEESLSTIKSGSVVVIKSTIPIGTTEKLQAKYPDLKLLFNPEFLSEATAYGDFVNPDRQFVGYTKQSYSVAMDVLNILPESPYGALVPSKEAELLKYINNLHGVLAVIEANHWYDICEKEGLDYERVIKASHASKWVGVPMGRQYHKIFHKGYRGVGGACFPKDLNAWIEYCDNIGVSSHLMKMARGINQKLLKAQGMTEEDAEKK